MRFTKKENEWKEQPAKVDVDGHIVVSRVLPNDRLLLTMPRAFSIYSQSLEPIAHVKLS